MLGVSYAIWRNEAFCNRAASKMTWTHEVFVPQPARANRKFLFFSIKLYYITKECFFNKIIKLKMDNDKFEILRLYLRINKSFTFVVKFRTQFKNFLVHYRTLRNILEPSRTFKKMLEKCGSLWIISGIPFHFW